MCIYVQDIVSIFPGEWEFFQMVQWACHAKAAKSLCLKFDSFNWSEVKNLKNGTFTIPDLYWSTTIPLADQGGAAGTRPPQESRFFRFDIQILRNVAASGVGAPPPPTGNP